MVDFCESCSPFHVFLTICPSTHLVYTTSLLSHFIHIWYLGWPWSEHAHIILISRMVDFCERCSTFDVCLTICPSAHLKCDKRQMTNCVHKMCGRTYGQTNIKSATSLAKINHPWNQYNMCMLRSWPTKIPNSFVAFYSDLVSWLATFWACA
jgi:hypothetical protein